MTANRRIIFTITAEAVIEPEPHFHVYAIFADSDGIRGHKKIVLPLDIVGRDYETLMGDFVRKLGGEL